MNITPFEHEGKFVVDSRDVAEMTGKRHDNLIRDIDGYARILTSSNLRTSDFFITCTYKDSKGEERPRYLLTRKGCDMVANKMTGEKGVLFTAAYVTKFEEMEKRIADPYAGLSPEVRAIFAVDTKVQKLEHRIEEIDSKVETQITLTQGEQRRIQKAVGAKVHEFADSKESRSPLYQELYRDIKDRWGIPSYRDLLRKDMPAVLKYIDAWMPTKKGW